MKTGANLSSCDNLRINLGTNFAGSMTVTATNGRALLGIVYDFYESTQRISGDTLLAR